MQKIDIDKIFTSDNKNDSIITLDNFIADLCNYGDNVDKLTDPQKYFFYNQNLEREINNGGFNQYFVNSSGDFAHETILSLKIIGADKTADILQQAINQFPDKKVPKDRNTRIEIVEQIQGIANDIWEELDQKFFEYQDDLNSLNLDFVKKHKDKF
jgi:hypothetical protein